MNVKVTVDYFTGNYDITGFYNGKGITDKTPRVLRKYKPIRGEDYDLIPKAQYNRFTVAKRRYEVSKLVDKLNKENPTLKLSKKALKHLDLTMYKTLEYWDILSTYTTNYSNTYLKIMLQNFEKPSNSKISSRKFKKQCKEKIASDLKNAGIDLSYNLGIFNTNKSMTIMDKIKGMHIARTQKKYFGIDVKNHLFLKTPCFLEDAKLNYNVENSSKTQENLQQNEKEDKSKLQNVNVKYVDLLNGAQPSSRYAKTSDSKQHHWIRKINSIKDSINKKSIPKNFRRLAISGVAILLATGAIVPMVHQNVSNFMKKHNRNAQETELDASNENEKDNEIVFPETEKTAEIKIQQQPEMPNQKQTEMQTELQSKTPTQTQPEMQIQLQSKTPTQTQTEMQTELQSKAPTQTQTEMQTELQSKAPTQSQTEATKQKEANSTKQFTLTKENISKKLKHFKKIATQQYMDKFVIGKHPEVGGIFKEQTFSENPDGTGNIGHFDKHPNYDVEQVIVMTDKDWYTETVDGENLPEILSKYQNVTGYSIHFVDSETGGGLGFVTNTQLDNIIQEKVKKIANKKIAKLQNNNSKVEKSKIINFPTRENEDYER